MSSEFVETGQTFTGEGDAYCPVERRRRGPAAVAASMAVLFAGAAFLAYAMMSAPTPVVEPSSSTAPDSERTNLSDVAPANANEASDIAPETAPEQQATGSIELTIEEALAESRAARASVVANKTPAERGFAPRLNPRRLADAEAAETNSETGFGPRLKPAIETVQQTAAPTPRQTAMQIGGAVLAGPDDQPPPFFFASDIERRTIVDIPPAILYAGDIDRSLEERRVRIKRGENFVDALGRAGIGAGDRNDAAYVFGQHYNLRQLRPGQEFSLTVGWPNQTLFELAAAESEPAPQLIALDFRGAPESRIHLRRSKDGFVGETIPIVLTTRILSFAGEIDGSLYLSAKAAGAPDQVIADLAGAFAYDVDFQREIFGGDEFEAIFEARYDEEGALVSSGEILYARLNWRGRSREKGYYQFSTAGDRADFYDATGQSAKRLLMKTPIDGARLSSTFGRRRHPILGYARAHKGLDFAAPRGTPIKAAGDGVVERADRYGSFGNYVRIRHANGYKTAYAHLRSFRRGVRKGKRVRQGDIIGYVGTTGRSTGPHLHYEVHLNGTAVNPQRLKIATGKQLKGVELERFIMVRDLIDAMRTPPEKAASLFAVEGSAKGSSL